MDESLIKYLKKTSNLRAIIAALPKLEEKIDLVYHWYVDELIQRVYRY